MPPNRRRPSGRAAFARSISGPLSAFWAEGQGPSNAVTRAAIQTAGLEYIGSNKQERILNAFNDADRTEALGAVEELVKVLRDQGVFVRANRRGTGDVGVSENVTRLRAALEKNGYILDSQGNLLEAGSEEAEDLDAGDIESDPAADSYDVAPRPAIHHRKADQTVTPQPPSGNSDRDVFLVHGRNRRIKNSMIELIEAFDLRVFEWEEAVKLTGKTLPTTMEVVIAGMNSAAAIVVLFTPDDEGRCLEEFRDPNDGQHEREFTPQARMNVIFEAGMAMHKDPGKTVLVKFGSVREMSDISGVNYISIRDSVDARRAIGERLDTAGAAVVMSRDKWRTAGDFSPASTPQSSSAAPSAGGPTAQPEPPPADLTETVKRYVTDPSLHRHLVTLVKDQTRKLRRAIKEQPLQAVSPQTLESLETRYRTLYELTEPLLRILHVSIDYGYDEANNTMWRDTLQQLVDARGKVERSNNNPISWTTPDGRYEKARQLPALLAFRVAGLTALCCEDAAASLWITLAEEVKWRPPELDARVPKYRALRVLDEHEVLDERAVSVFQPTENFDPNKGTVLSRYLRSVLRPLFREACPDDDGWDRLNDQYEYRRALFYLYHHIEPGPILAASGPGRWTSGGWQPEVEFVDIARSSTHQWPWWPIIGDQARFARMVDLVRDRVGHRYAN